MPKVKRLEGQRTFTLRIPKEDHARMGEIALARGTTRSELMRLLLRSFIRRGGRVKLAGVDDVVRAVRFQARHSPDVADANADR